MPQWNCPLQHQTLKVNSALTESGIGLVHDTTDGECDLPGSSGLGTCAGIFPSESCDSGDYIDLVTAGMTFARVNANSVNIARGDFLKIVTTTGRWVKAATDKDIFYLRANEAATADGVLISVQIMAGTLSAT